MKFEMKIRLRTVMLAAFVGASCSMAQRQMEKLDRGVVAVNQGEGRVFVSWRLLGTEPDDIAFNVYRTSGDSEPVKQNAEPLGKATCYQDNGVDFAKPVAYTVRAIVDGEEQADSKAFTFAVNAPARPYLSIPLQDGLSPNDASIGDLNGDGEYEIVLKREERGRDNSQNGVTGETHLEAYQLNGTFMWRINLGRNIRSGAHYTQFMVYDLDGDGRAEVACKTADGTVDAKGTVIGDADANWVDRNGRVLKGPEFFTVFDGKTGSALVTTDYIPARGNLDDWGGVGGNGGNDNRGNRADRFLACVAYLDGVRPSVIMCRGYYGRTVLAAWDYRDGTLTSRWVFDTGISHPPYTDASIFSGQGNHSIIVADVDADGKDEIVYGAMCVDDDGTGQYSTKLRHGDASHCTDLDPSRPGLEVWGIHENEEPVPGYENGYGAALFDAATGEIIFGKDEGMDVGRGVAADIDPRHPGAEMWGGSGGLFTCKGEDLGPRPRTQNFLAWWDGDLLRETLNGNQISKWDWEKGTETPLLTAEGSTSNNGTKATPTLSADLFGDWREEVIWRTRGGRELRIYTTTIPTEHRIYTLMHDPQYRLSVAWQNVGYNQPPHPGFFLGAGMEAPPKPKIQLIEPVDISL